jgi:hypothetical protein
VRAIADREPIAMVEALAATLSTQAGEWPAAIPYAQRAAAAGILGPLQGLGANLLNDPNQAEQGIGFLRQVVDAGFPIDPLVYITGAAPSLANRPELLERLLEVAAVAPAPAGLRAQWEAITSTMRDRATEVIDAARVVHAERERVVASMTADAQLVADERTRMGELVEEVSDLANQGAVDHLAKEYAKHAEEEEDTADSYTRWSIGFGLVSILATSVIAYLAFSKEHGTGAIATKAALALPIVVFAGYLGRLATVHRRQAWR